MDKFYIYVYDLSMGMAELVSRDLLGMHIEAVWHTSFIAFGCEYYFGDGIIKQDIGIFEKDNFPIKPLRKIEIADLYLTKEIFESKLEKLSNNFCKNSYHLLDHNCNHFCQALLQELNAPIKLPQKILDLPIRIKKDEKIKAFVILLLSFFQN